MFLKSRLSAKRSAKKDLYTDFTDEHRFFLTFSVMLCDPRNGTWRRDDIRAAGAPKKSFLYGVKLNESVTQVPFCPVSEQSVTVTRSLCPVGL